MPGRCPLLLGLSSFFDPAFSKPILSAVASESWWLTGSTEVRFWDVNWMVPAASCGVTVELCRKAEAGGAQASCDFAWSLNFAEFLRRALEYYGGTSPQVPPMREVWLLHMLNRLPENRRENIPNVEGHFKSRCLVNWVFYVGLYCEYLLHVAPPEIIGGWLDGRMALQMEGGLSSLWAYAEPYMAITRKRLQAVGGLVNQLAHGASPLVVDLVIAHCREGLAKWLQRVLRVLERERTETTVGMRLRIFVYGRCPDFEPRRAQELLEDAKQRCVVEAVHWVRLQWPWGYENVVYVFHLLRVLGQQPMQGRVWERWPDSLLESDEESPDYIIFLHGSPGDHLEFGLLEDVFRVLALHRYDVPFLHLNVKRTPPTFLPACQRDLLGPLLDQAMPLELSTYCCAQFVVARDRLHATSLPTWRRIWEQFLVPPQKDGLPPSCIGTQQLINRSHWRGHQKGMLWGVALETLWHWLLGEEAVLPLRELDSRLPLAFRVQWRRASADGGPCSGARVSQEAEALPDWGFDPEWGNETVPTLPIAFE